MILATEEQARAWIDALPDVSRETLARLDAFEALLRLENERHNLVADASLPHLWVRHFADSAQLLAAAGQWETWLDIGSGAGLPGLVIAAMTEGRVTLVEPRRLRVAFLEDSARVLGIADRVTVVQAKVERLPVGHYDVISARAVAKLPELLALSHPFSTEKTRLVFPKGRSAQTELADAQRLWQGSFRRIPSLTDPEASIIVAEGVSPRRAKSGKAGR